MNTASPAQPGASIAPRITPSIVAANAFSDEECDRIIEAGKRLSLETGVIDETEISFETRKSNVAFFRPGEETQWMYDRIITLAAEANKEHWRFELAGVEPMQFGSYANTEHYDWHMDMGDMGETSLRKLTASVQLTDPATYDGGEFEMSYGSPTVMAPRDRGGVLFFPSYIMHRVLAVSRGTRYSLVAWIVGDGPLR